MPSCIRIATRASQLALWQAHEVARLIGLAAPQVTTELVTISTKGDRELADPLRSFGGMGVFTREVQQAVLAGTADIAVHSLKDLPTDSAPGLVLAGIPARGLVLDVIVMPQTSGQQPVAPATAIELIRSLPHNAEVGTGSPRRQAQLLRIRPDLQLLEVRGNIETRLRKLDEGGYNALVLANAGLDRLGLSRRISAIMAPPLMYPAVGQGALGIECRTDDQPTIAILHALSDPLTRNQVTAERALLSTLRAGCHAPLGIFSQGIEPSGLHLEAVLMANDGRTRLTAAATGPANRATELGECVAQLLLDQGGAALLK